MEKTWVNILSIALTAVLIVFIGAFFISDNWFDTTFKSVSEINITVDEKDYVFPLIEHTAVMYKTSDSSYVLISKCRFDELRHFYKKTNKLQVDESSDGLFIDKDGLKYAVKRLADDLDYVEYSVEVIH